MKIEVNGTAREVRSRSLAQALVELGFADGRFATAVNGEFIPRDARESHVLAAGDRIEVLAPMQGG